MKIEVNGSRSGEKLEFEDKGTNYLVTVYSGFGTTQREQKILVSKAEIKRLAKAS